MNISTEALIYKAALEEWCSANGGIAIVVSNLRMLWQQAAMESDRVRALICYVGESARGPFSRAAATGRVDRQWQIAFTRGRGLNEDRGTSLTDTVGNADPFLDLVENGRDKIRCLFTTSVEAPLDYKGMEPMSMGNLIVDGYTIKFSTAHDLPGLTQTSPTGNPI